jgi:AcrR family transcriptional regulator
LVKWALSFCDDEVARLCGLGLDGAPPLPAAAVEPPPGDERAMILAATARLASQGHYATLTVSRLRAAAGVSGHRFYKHFEGVADCFLATLEMLSDRTLAAAEPSYLTADDWASGVHHMVARLCRQLAGDPDFAKLAFREVFSPGPQADQWRSEMIVKLAARLRRGAPPQQRPTVFAAEASIGAMWGVIHHFVASGSGDQLPIAAPVLSYIALAPAIGGAAAVDAMVGSPAKVRPTMERVNAR